MPRPLPFVLALVAFAVACSDDETSSDWYVPPDGGTDANLDSTVPDALDAGSDARSDVVSEVGPDAPLSVSHLQVWAPNATNVDCVGSFGGENEQSLAMTSEAGGMWSLDVPEAEQGDAYRFHISTAEGTFDRVDPRALARDPSGASSLIWPQEYAWASSEAGFLRPGVRDAIVYEMHAGTYNDEPGGTPGSLLDAAERLDHLASLGVNVVELLPITEFPGDYSWGYNPELPYVVDSIYGGPDALRTFVEAAHARGIAVVLDVVYNHLTEPNPLCAFDGGDVQGCGGVYFYEGEYPDTPWGPRFDYDRSEVRAYLQDNAWMWVDTFHIDGLRWDSTGNIRATDHGNGDPIPAGEQFLREANASLHEGSPGLLSIAEDLSGNPSLTRPVDQGGYVSDALWHADFHGRIVAQLKEAGVGDPDMGSVREAILDDTGAGLFERIIYTESHDSTGQLNGHVRLPQEVAPGDPDGVRAQRLSAVAVALTLTSPGIPMLLQGQELLESGSFHDDAPLDWARETTHGGFVELVRALIDLRRNGEGIAAGLRGDGITVHHVNDGAKVLAFHRYDAGGPADDVVVIVSLSPNTYPTYRIGVPAAGTWQVRLDSSWETYKLGYDAGMAGPSAYVAEPDGYDELDANVLVSIAPYGVLVLSQDE